MSNVSRMSALVGLSLGLSVMVGHAQGTKTMGLVAGANFATLNGDDVSEGAGTRTGFVGGLFVAIPVGSGGLAIEPEVLYSMQGATYDNAFFKGTYAADYIQIPVFLKWSANSGAKGFYLMAGPSVGFNVSCNDSGDIAGGGGSYDGSCEDEDGISAKTTFSGNLGAGYSTGRFGIEGRYLFDFGDAFEDTDTGTSLAFKNSVISVLVRLTK